MKPILETLSRKILDRPPVWLMRQAGRYLPEYRQVREQAGSFLNLVYSSDWAVEVTMQPIRRFGFDAAILFSDILVVPHAMGVDVTFEVGEGPRLNSVETIVDLEKLNLENTSQIYAPVIQTVRGIQQKLTTEGFDQTALIGFAGAPWTIACYMTSGSGKDHDFPLTVRYAEHDPVFFDRLIDQITDVTIRYLIDQIEAGANVIQLFDSWSGTARGDLFDRYVIAPTQKIVLALHQAHPAVPVIGFPRLAGTRMMDYHKKTNVTAIQCDTTVDLMSLFDQDQNIVTQGNLDPDLLIKGGSELDHGIDHILNVTQGRPHIFNLGHGILPQTPIAHVEQLIKRIKGF